VKDRNHLDALCPVWRYHPFFTDNTEQVTDADITHRQHAIVESVFADLIDGPWAHQPSGRFSSNAAWPVLAAITHNLLRAAGTLAAPHLGKARGATLRRQIINVPARSIRAGAGGSDQRRVEWMDGWADGWADGRKGRWTDGWADGQMDGRMGGWTDGVVGGLCGIRAVGARCSPEFRPP